MAIISYREKENSMAEIEISISIIIAGGNIESNGMKWRK
jgi:hypothetical protein